MLQDFKKFLLRGNLIDLAVAVIIGLAFAAVVNSLVADIVTPLIAAVGNQPDFSSLEASVGDGVLKYGVFLNALINFVIVGAVMLLIVKGVEKMEARRAKGDVPEAEKPAPTKDQELLTEIRDLLAGQKAKA
ncbi:MAG: large conductance mechanosensitive channel protein MscL [Acidimicrobiales bacterium]